MKTRILSMRNVPVSIIVFLLLVTTTTIGCGTLAYRVLGLDPVSLTLEDLDRMGLTKRNRIRHFYGPYDMLITEVHRSGALRKKSPVIGGFEQRKSGGTVQYWLFDSSSTAKKAAAIEWIWTSAAPVNFHPELNPEDIIGDATWRRIHKRRKEWEKGPTDLYFVKYNLLVYVRTQGHPSNRLQIARDVARNIEAKIDAVLPKKKNTDSLDASTTPP